MPNNIITIPLTKGMLPDLLPYQIPQGNVQSIVGGYVSPLGIQSIGTEITLDSGSDLGGCLGAKSVVALDGTSYVIWASTLGKIYRGTTDITKLATTYNTSARWSFAQFGDWLIATNGVDVPQVLKGIGTSANFVDLGGSPPIAKYVIVKNKSVLFGYTTESAVNYPKRVRWSAYNNAESWTASVSTGAGFVDVVEADGYITGMEYLGNGFAIGFTRGICYVQWVGGQESFRFSNLQGYVSCLPYTMAGIGDRVIFMGNNHAYSFDGSNAKEIGIGFGRKDFNSNTPQDVLVDRIKGQVFWSLRPSSIPYSIYDILCYNYEMDAFAYASKTRTWAAGNAGYLCLYLYDGGSYFEHNLGMIYKPATGNTFRNYFAAATPAAITVISPEIGDGHKIYTVTDVRPRYPVTSLTLNTRMLETDSATSSAAISRNTTTGWYNVRGSGRYFSVTATYTPNIPNTALNICNEINVKYEATGEK